jgi:hypothetical protein
MWLSVRSMKPFLRYSKWNGPCIRKIAICEQGLFVLQFVCYSARVGQFWGRRPYRISTKPANGSTICLKMSICILILTSIVLDQYDWKLEKAVERIWSVGCRILKRLKIQIFWDVTSWRPLISPKTSSRAISLW